MRQVVSRVGRYCQLGALWLLLACSTPPEPTDGEAPDTANFAQYTLKRVPATVQHRTYLDFGGKVQLIGYDVSPSDVAPPGSTVSLTLYWQRTGSLDQGWKLFTHILDANGRQIAQRDSSGPLRQPTPDGGQAFGPSSWELGKIYVDELSIEVPGTQQRGGRQVPLATETITLAVGVWKDAARLDVLGGASDAHRRGFVTSLKTGVKLEAQREAEQDTQKASDG